MSAQRPVSRRPLDAREAPALGGFNLTFLSIEIRRLLRNRRTVVVTLITPVVLFLLFTSNRRAVALGGIEITAATTMVGIAVYGAMLAATSGGAMVSLERALGWSRQLRLTPLRPAAYIAIKVLTAMLLGLTSVAVVYGFGLVDGVQMAPPPAVLPGNPGLGRLVRLRIVRAVHGLSAAPRKTSCRSSVRSWRSSRSGWPLPPGQLLAFGYAGHRPLHADLRRGRHRALSAGGGRFRSDLVGERGPVDRGVGGGRRWSPARHAPQLPCARRLAEVFVADAARAGPLLCGGGIFGCVTRCSPITMGAAGDRAAGSCAEAPPPITSSYPCRVDLTGGQLTARQDDIAIRIEGLVKDYGSVQAVRGIDLEVRRGEVFGFLGPNGAARPPRSAACSTCCARPQDISRSSASTRAGTPWRSCAAASRTCLASCACPSG